MVSLDIILTLDRVFSTTSWSRSVRHEATHKDERNEKNGVFNSVRESSLAK